MRKKFFIAILLLIINCKLSAQSSYVVTDKAPLTLNGLVMGYNIRSQEVKEVGDKGNFSRYALTFYVSNPTTESKIILYKEGWNPLGNISDQIAQFNCLNATGARLTSKQVIISAPPCEVLAKVKDQDHPSTKPADSRFVQIGFWIKAGQTITADVIMIVPLNEQPNVEVVYLMNQLQPTATAAYAAGAAPGYNQANQNLQTPPIQYNSTDFIKIRNLSNNTYINVETGVPGSTVIDPGWWSAQWQILPIPGSNNFYLKNRWKETYIGTANKYVVLTDNYQIPSSMWLMLTTSDPNVVRFKNAQTGGYLSIGYGNLIISPTASTDFNSANWQLEKAQ